MNFTNQKVQDPVCGMWIEPEDAAEFELYKGRIFYFCAPSCKKDFLIDPQQYFSANKPFNQDSQNLGNNNKFSNHGR